MSNIKISEVEKAFKEIFDVEKGVVNTIDVVYESPKDDDYLKLVISIHGLMTDNISIIHTKFIFRTDLNKRNIIDDSFIYLFDINCVYHKIEFKSITDMKNKIEDIIQSGNFSENIMILSDFIEAPAMFLNYYMKRAKISEYSIFDVQYEPKFKTTPCDKTTFDFKININNNYTFELSIFKNDKEDDEEEDIFKFQFQFLDDIETIETDTLNNIHYIIGSNIARILDKKLKNK